MQQDHQKLDNPRLSESVPVQGEPGNNRQEILTGIKFSIPAGLGMYPIGIAFGLLVVQYGFDWWVAPLFSLLVFAGSTELVVVAMVVMGTPLSTIALTSFLINFRHAFYAFSFPLRVVRNKLARLYSVFALVDEAYAVTAAQPEGWTARRLVSMQLAFHSYWVGGGLTGVAISSFMPGDIVGLDFALCALFVTLTMDACRSRQQIPAFLLAGLSFTFALILFPGSALFAALVGFMMLLAVRYLISRKVTP